MSHERENEMIVLEDEKAALIRDHNYDGILELSRPMPTWLSLIFFFTVTFGLLYMLHFSTGSGPNQEQELAAKMLVIEKQQKAAQNKAPQTAPPPSGEDSLKIGQKVFSSKCAACHGSRGEGTIGPNLTDRFWLNGKGQREDIHQIVQNGVPEKGMPAWNQVLKPEELAGVVAYVHSLVGQNVPNGKAPQGKEL